MTAEFSRHLGNWEVWTNCLLSLGRFKPICLTSIWLVEQTWSLPIYFWCIQSPWDATEAPQEVPNLSSLPPAACWNYQSRGSCILSLILHTGMVPVGGLETALTLLFESPLALGTSLHSVGKPCTGTRAGQGVFWEWPNCTGKHSVLILVGVQWAEETGAGVLSRCFRSTKFLSWICKYLIGYSTEFTDFLQTKNHGENMAWIH